MDSATDQLPVVDAGAIGFEDGPWEVSQHPDFAEIFCRHHHLSPIDVQGALVYAKHRPLLGITRASLEGPEAAGSGTVDAVALRALGAGRLDLASLHPVPRLAQARVPGETLFAFVTDLAVEPELLWARMHKRCRNAVRRGQRAGLVVSEIATAAELDASIDLLTAVDPDRAPSRALAQELFDAGVLRGLSVTDGDARVGASLYLVRRHAHGWLSAFVPGPDRLPGNLMYWEGIRWAARAGFRIHDFGVQSLTELPGIVRFKRAFAPALVPVHRYRLWAPGPKGALLRWRARMAGEASAGDERGM